MGRKEMKRNKKQISFIHSFILSFFLSLIRVVSLGRAQELGGFMYLYGEMGGDYFSDEKLLNFRVGQIDLLSSLRFERVEGFFEAVFEHEVVDVERLYLGYDFHKLFTLRLGRFHTPVGYFIREWHHGLYLMPTIRKPLIVEFEDMGGPLPYHIIGFEAEGYTDIGEIRPGYIIDIGTGNLQFGASNEWDFDKEKTFVGKLFVRKGFGEISISVGYDPFRIKGLPPSIMHGGNHQSMGDGTQGGTQGEEGEIRIQNFLLGDNISYNNISGLIALVEAFLIRDLESKKSGWGGFVILSYHAFGSEVIYSIRPYLQVATLDWQDGNPFFERLQAKLQEEGEGGGYGARNLFNKHIEYSAGLKVGISPEFAVKIGISFFDMKKIKDRYFISLSAGWGIPIFER